jgi:uncharacterized repeat protein (TIGR03803 family)
VKFSKRARQVVLMLAILVAIVLPSGPANAWGQSYRVIYDFGHTSSNGWFPVGVPAVAKNGDLYGVTESGGIYNLGTFFKLTAPPTRNGAWMHTVLYDFPGGNGGEHPGLLLIGGDGNLYGADFGQTIFQLRPPTSHDGVWKYTALYTLNGQNEGSAIEGLIFDAAGNLYGATELGGDLGCRNGGCGTVFELKRPTKSSGKWRFSVLHTFTGIPDGEEPFAGVTFDQNGNLYGTTHAGGAFGYGTAYRLTPPAKRGQSWTEAVLYSFDRSGNEGNSPVSPVIFDGSNKLYGTTVAGGDLNCQGGIGCGVVYVLSPPAKDGASWAYSALYAFQGGNDGITPTGYMVFDSKGNLYGATQYGGGATEGGTVYRLKRPARKGGAWTETVLHAFTGSNGDGNLPANGLTWGKWHDLYGETWDGGLCQACGTAFELQP